MLTIEKMRGGFVGRTRKLYHSAFLEWERIPFWSLRARSLMKDLDLLALCDDGEFCGFACLTTNDEGAYVHYLAIEPSKRGQGLGGQALELLAQRYEPKSIALDIEAVRPGTEGAKERSKHRKLYLRNGYKESGYCYKDGGILYEILVRGQKLDQDAYRLLINKLAFGLTKIMPKKMD